MRPVGVQKAERIHTWPLGGDVLGWSLKVG